jgi:hypothetical protein
MKEAIKTDRVYGNLVYRITRGPSGINEIQYLIYKQGKNSPFYTIPCSKFYDADVKESVKKETRDNTGIRSEIEFGPAVLEKAGPGKKDFAIYLSKYTAGYVCSDGACKQHDLKNYDVRFVTAREAKAKLPREFSKIIDMANKKLGFDE